MAIVDAQALPPGYVPIDDRGIPRPDLLPPPPGHPDRRSPPLIDPLYRLMLPYLNLTFINHGYEFFAPDPGATKLIRYQAFDEQGQPIAEQLFPDRERQRPRLFYHRHMMLAEQALELGPQALRTYGRHLLERHDAARVRLEYLVHLLLSPEQRREGMRMDDEGTYRALDVVEVTRDDDDVPVRPAEQVQIPGVTP